MLEGEIMIIVDKEIKRRAGEIFLNDYDDKNVNAVSYDLHIEGIIINDKLENSYSIRPNEIVFVKMLERISMPGDLMGRIAQKNSRIRQGLAVEGPHYFPGHTTTIFLRVHNLTGDNIRIRKGDSIAQIMFEQLAEVPAKPYDRQVDAAFNDETEYTGMARYADEYTDRIEKIKETEQELETRVNSIYGNVLTFMGIFVAIFSFIIVNFSGLRAEQLTKEFILTMNLSLGIVITLFMGLLLIFLNKAKNKVVIGVYCGVLVALLALLLVCL